MSRSNKIGVGVLGLLLSCLLCAGGIIVAGRLGWLPISSPLLPFASAPVIPNTESPSDTPSIVTRIIDDEAWIIGAPTSTVIPLNAPTATPTWIAVLLPLVPYEPTHTPIPTHTPTPTPTPIGSGMGKIVFVNEDPSGDKIISNIFVMDSDGSNQINITNNSDPLISPYFPNWSASGDQIIFTRGDETGGGNKSEIFIMDVDGSDVQKLSPAPQSTDEAGAEGNLRDYYADMSPQGDLIAFNSNRHSLSSVSEDAEIYLLDMSSKVLTQLTNDLGDSQNPSWSPDGGQIAFMSSRDGDWEIYLMQPDGSGLQQLTENTYADRFPRWSPDGSTIIFHSDRDGNIELYTITIADRVESKLTDNPATDASASWSPDGEWVVFASARDGDDDIYIMKIDGSGVKNLTDNSTNDFLAYWSP